MIECSTSTALSVARLTGVEAYQIGSDTVITIQPSTGYVCVACMRDSALNGSHWWQHRGNESLKQFLIGLGKDYVMKNLFDPRSLVEFDLNESIAGIKAHIIELRRDGTMGENRARRIFDEADSCECEMDIANLELDCAYEWILSKEKECVAWFWDEVWTAFIQHMRTEEQGVAP
jgi:hypothetical protein